MSLSVLTSTISWSCDGCHRAGPVDVPLGSDVEAMRRRVQDAHREMSSSCRRIRAKLSPQRSYLDNFLSAAKTVHPHFWLYDPGPLDRAEYKDGPLIVIAKR